MAFGWLSSIKEISEIISGLSSIIKNNNATKDLLLRELRLNIKAFETARKSKITNYDNLLSLLKNEKIKAAREKKFNFSKIKHGEIHSHHIYNDRNKKYLGKNCEWLFKNIDEKIEDLRNQKNYFGSLNKIDKTNVALQFSNLFYKMKLLADFIRN